MGKPGEGSCDDEIDTMVSMIFSLALCSTLTHSEL